MTTKWDANRCEQCEAYTYIIYIYIIYSLHLSQWVRKHLFVWCVSGYTRKSSWNPPPPKKTGAATIRQVLWKWYTHRLPSSGQEVELQPAFRCQKFRVLKICPPKKLGLVFFYPKTHLTQHIIYIYLELLEPNLFFWGGDLPFHRTNLSKYGGKLGFFSGSIWKYNHPNHQVCRIPRRPQYLIRLSKVIVGPNVSYFLY